MGRDEHMSKYIEKFQSNFNPRAPVGRDDYDTATALLGNQFQSTRPCGTRLYLFNKLNINNLNFNPRAPVGRDVIVTLKDYVLIISIHAPLWDATLAIVLKITSA